jgi:outer membrane protein
LIRTRNGLLPQLDLFVSLGQSGYAASFGGSARGDDGTGWDSALGVKLGYAFGNRDGRAANRAAQFSKDQIAASLANQQLLAETDVRSAYIELSRAREQIAATAASSRLQEEKAHIEREKLLVGKSTTLLVAQAERDRLQARLAEAQTVVRNLNALVELFRIDGSLLQRKGVTAPGDLPIP